MKEKEITMPNSMSYVGVAPCGCILGAAVDNPEHGKDVRKFVQDFMRDGFTIERRTNEEVRQQFCTGRHKKGVCPHPEGCPERGGHAV